MELKSNQISNEKWIIYATGCQYGFRDVLAPFDKYFVEKACCDLGRLQPYDANETKDVDYFSTLPFMMAFDRQRKKLMAGRAARLHFAAFVKTHIDEGGVNFNKNMLSGSTSDFQAKLNVFIRDLKVHMVEFIEKTYGEAGSAKNG